MELQKNGLTGCAGCPPCCKNCVFELPEPKPNTPVPPKVMVTARDYGCNKGGSNLVKYDDGRVGLLWQDGKIRFLGAGGHAFLVAMKNPLLPIIEG